MLGGVGQAGKMTKGSITYKSCRLFGKSSDKIPHDPLSQPRAGSKVNHS